MLYTQQASGKIIKDDVNDFSSISDICFIEGGDWWVILSKLTSLVAQYNYAPVYGSNKR
jgi:hypothetical protein